MCLVLFDKRAIALPLVQANYHEDGYSATMKGCILSEQSTDSVALFLRSFRSHQRHARHQSHTPELSRLLKTKQLVV